MENLLLVGGLMYVIGWIWLSVLAFKEGIVWGLAVLFVPCVAFIFALIHGNEARLPFLIAVFGNVLMGIALKSVEL